MDANASHRAPRAHRRRRHAVGPRLPARAHRLLVGLPRGARPPDAGGRLGRRRRLLHPLGPAVDAARHPLRRRRDARGQRRRAGAAGQRRRYPRLVRPARSVRRCGHGRARAARLRLGRPRRVDPRGRAARGVRDHARGGSSSCTSPRSPPSTETVRRGARPRGSPTMPGAAALRLGPLPAAAVGVHELPLQPGLRVLLGGVVAAGTPAVAGPGALHRAGRRRRRRGLHRALRHRGRAVPRARPRSTCSSRPPSASTWSA